MADVQRQLELFDIARSVMRNTGNMEQWTNGYPSQEVIEDDIVAGNSYVCEYRDWETDRKSVV